jgi:hypothetical protein
MKGDNMKRKRIWLLAAELTLICILVGCGRCECGPIYRKELNLLEAGMTKAQVLEIMEQPYERAAYSNLEWLVYQTDSKFKHKKRGRGSELITKPHNEWLTPLLFRDGKLVGIDKNYWDKYKFRALK